MACMLEGDMRIPISEIKILEMPFPKSKSQILEI